MGQLSTLSILEGKCDIIFHVLCTSKRRKGDAGSPHVGVFLKSDSYRARSEFGARGTTKTLQVTVICHKSHWKNVCWRMRMPETKPSITCSQRFLWCIKLARVLGLPSLQRFWICSTQGCILILKIFVKLNWLVQDYSMSLHQWPMLGLH